MDAIKVKNFIILVLLIVNVVLLSTVISDRMRGSELWNEAVEGAVALALLELWLERRASFPLATRDGL